MNKEDKLLTIIIPSYNMERYLVRCLESLLLDENRQNSLDILVVNDGSRDATSQIGHRYQELYPGTIRVIDKENGHYGSCVNRGLSEAKGTFVKILDADDAFEPSVFSRFIDFLSDEQIRETADLVLSDYCEVTEDGEVFKQVQYGRYQGPSSLGDMSDNDRRRWFIHGLTYRLDNLKQIGYIQSEGIPYTDNEWAFVPLMTVKNIFKFDGSLYRYTVGRDGQSIAPQQHAKGLSAEVQVVESLLRHFDKMPVMSNPADQGFIERRLYGSVENIYCLYLMWLYPYVSSYAPLKGLDHLLKDRYPGLYASTDLFQTTVGGVRFHTIRNWRRGRNYLVKAQRSLYKIADQWNSLRKRWKNK